MNPADPLAALRDIRVPDPPPFWPPAPGWIAIACVAIAAALAGTIVAARWWRRGRPRRDALARLRSLHARHDTGASDREIAIELSMLVRRFVLARHPREEVAGLVGERWIAWLESTQPGLGAAARAALLDAPYARECRFDAPRALTACEHWIRRT